MKTSNKLLLGAVLLPLIFVTAMQLTIYAKYKAGDFVNEKEEHAKHYDRKEFTAPGYLSLKGIREVHLVASDTFAVEYPKDYHSAGKYVKREVGVDGSVTTVTMDEPELHFLQNGDTLTIVGYDSAAWNDPKMEHKEEHAFPGITVYCRGIHAMDLDGVKAELEQQRGSVLSPVSRIGLRNSEWAFGNPDEVSGNDTFVRYWYETVQVRAENSKLDLNSNLSIKDLTVVLDSLSSLNDHVAQVGRLELQWSDRSQIQLSGSNLRKLETGKP